MAGSWTITTEPNRRLLRLTLAGQFTLADVAAMDRERQRAIGTLRCGFNKHLALCDVHATELSTPEVAAALQQAIGQPLFRAKRCAMVISGAVARIQARRVVGRDDIAFFEMPEEAEAWLMRMDTAEAVVAA